MGPGSAERIQPLQVSWGWRHDRTRLDERDEFGSTPRLRYFEFEGTRDVCPWLVVPAAIAFQASLGWEAIRDRITELTAYVHHRLTGRAELAPATPFHPDLCGALTAFCFLRRVDAPVLQRSLWERFRIEVPIIDRPEKVLLRVSTHFYNTQQEVDLLVEALDDLLGGGG